jgi:hypothetical protein
VAGAWADAVALYRGDLLDGLFPGGVGEEFQTWLEQERGELRDLASRACWELSNAADVAGQKDSAIALARRAVDLNPDDEDGVRRLIAALDRHGDRAGAMKVFTSWQAHLEAEYETVPAPETRKLARHVRAARPGESAENTPIKMPPLAPPPVTYPTAARRGARLPMLAAAFAAGIILTISAISLLPLRSGSRPTFPTVVIRPVAATTGGQSQLIADVLAADLASELARAGVSVRPSSGLVQQGETTGDNAYLVSVQVEPRNLARVELIRTSNQSLVWSHVVSRVDDPATRGTLVSELATGIADRLKAAR